MNAIASAPLTIPLKHVRESPHNPRRDFQDLKDLTESIKKVGVLSPILVRPVEDKKHGYEVVFGHRRLRAAFEAGLAEIPAMVRELDDVEVLEAQLIENLQRQDLHPLEEADGYRELNLKHGHHVDDIAAKVGKSKSYVYARLKLCELHAPARSAFLAGKVNPSVALLLARIPDEDLQARAALEVSDDYRHSGDSMSTREASDHIQAQHMLRLSDAPWSLADPELVPEAGACTKCPHRTGNQKGLFPDVKGADVCTLPPCFQRKLDAHWARRAAQVEQEGGRVLSDAESRKVVPYGHTVPGSKLIDLDDRCYDDPKNRTWRKMLGKEANALAITLARDPNGKVHELVDGAAARKAVGIKPERNGASSGSQTMRDEQKKAKLRATVARDAIAQVLAASRQKAFDEDTWRLIASALVRAHDVCVAVVKRLDLQVGKGIGVAEAVQKQVIETGTAKELQALLLECAITRDASWGYSSSFGVPLTKACELFGVDLKAIQARVAKELKEKKKPGKKAAAKAEKKPEGKKAKAKQKCRECGCTENKACDDDGVGCSWVEPDLCRACAKEVPF